jgi:S1-C subfamily serine protease
MALLARLGYRVLGQVAAAPQPPRFIHQLLWLGATVQMMRGAPTVTSVAAGSRGQAAGLKKGDVLLSIDHKAVATSAELGEAFDRLEPGSRTAVVLRRGHARVDVEITRAKQGYLGIMPGELTDEQRKSLGLADAEGVLIRSVVPDGPAAKSGMKDGDVLVRLAGQPVGDKSLFLRLATIGAGERVVAIVVRDGARVELDLSLGERPTGG